MGVAFVVIVVLVAGGIAWVRRDTNKHPLRRGTSKPLAAATSSGATVRSLWQVDGLVSPTVIDNDVVGFLGVGTRPALRAMSAGSGTPRWTYALPASEPVPLELLAAEGVVVAVIGHIRGTRPAAPVAAQMLVVDEHSGRLLWSQSVGGFSQQPPVAIATNEVVTGDPLGNLNARDAHTGTRVWRRTRPAACPRAGVVLYDEAVVADGSLLAASYQCSSAATSRSLVERLDPSTGAATWQWATPELPGPLGQWLSVADGDSAGGAVVLTGRLPAKPTSLIASLGRPLTFPSGLGTPGNGTVVSLDAASGRPRWHEVGSELYSFVQITPVDGAVCETMTLGFECRDEKTGEPTRPVFVSGYGQGVIPPIEFDRFAGLSGTTAAAVVSSPSTDSVPVDVMPVRGNGPTVRVRVAISTTIFNGASQGTFVVGSGRLSDGSTILLIRRVDAKSDPILAVSVTPRR